MLEDLEGIIIREKDYGETSKIIDVFTKKYGIISLIAKGSKRPKSMLSGVSTKLTYGTFQTFYKEGKLSNLNSVDVINSFINMRKDISKISHATYLCELISQVIKQVSNQTDKEKIYDILISGLLKINNGFDELVITNIIELKLLSYLGVFPNIDNCSVCGSTTSIVTLSVDKHGLLCKDCRTTEPIVDLNVIKYIRMYYYLDISKISKIDINDNIKKYLDKFLTEYYEKHTGLYLNTKAFLKKINILC